MFDGLRAFVLAQNFALQGVPATVTRPSPDDVPIETRLIWLTNETVGAEFGRRDPMRVAVLMRSAVPTLPVKPTPTRILAPEAPGLEATEWLADEYLDERADQHRVIVVPAPET